MVITSTQMILKESFNLFIYLIDNSEVDKQRF